MLNMKKVLIAILACSALLVGTTACGTTNNTTSSTNSTTETTSSVVSQVTNPDYQKPENISTADDAKKALEAGNASVTRQRGLRQQYLPVFPIFLS